MKAYLGRNKKVYDTELYVIGEALTIALKNCQPGQERT